VVAPAAGGALETVLDGETGVLVTPGSVSSFAGALRDVDFGSFSPERIRRHAETFSVARFHREFSREVAHLTSATQS
jgi:glycosyltransferase involved in cell wall biosynthesis